MSGSLNRSWPQVPARRLFSVIEDRGLLDLPLLSSSSLHGVVPREQLASRVAMPQGDTAQYKRALPGDFVISMGSFDTGIEYSAFDGLVSPAYTVLRPRPGLVHGYYRHLLKSSPVLAELSVLARGIRQGKTITWDDFATLRLPLPPEGTQLAIAAHLDSETARIDALITKKQRMCEHLLELRAVTTEVAVGGGFSDSERTSCDLHWLESIPAQWRTAKLTLIARLGSGHTPSRSRPEWWVDCTIPWVTTGEVAEMRSDRQEYVTETREQISALGIANSSAVIHPAGTVVLCRTASAGYSAIMATDMATSQDFATWTCGPLLRPRFLLLCLRAMRRDLLGRLAMGSTHKTIYMPDVEAIRIPLPTLDEQDAIVDKVWKRFHRLDKIVDTTQRQIELLRERRQALITAAVTGELEVPGVAA